MAFHFYAMAVEAAARADIGVRELEQFTRLLDTRRQAVERADDALERGALATEFLGALRLAPDRRVLEFAQDLRQAFLATFVVKGTPSAPWCAGRGLRGNDGSG